MAIKVPAKYRNMEYADLIIEFIKLLKPKVYVEYGIKNGYTINKATPLVKRAIGVDINKSEDLDERIEFYHMPTAKFIKTWTGGKIDFLFVDADHNAVSVLFDVMESAEFFIPGKTIVFLHDTYPIKEELLDSGYCGDAWKTAAYIHKNRTRFEIMTIPGPWAGLSILRYLGDGRLHGWMEKESK